jgi:hypothetical protein
MGKVIKNASAQNTAQIQLIKIKVGILPNFF